MRGMGGYHIADQEERQEHPMSMLIEDREERDRARSIADGSPRVTWRLSVFTFFVAVYCALMLLRLLDIGFEVMMDSDILASLHDVISLLHILSLTYFVAEICCIPQQAGDDGDTSPSSPGWKTYPCYTCFVLVLFASALISLIIDYFVAAQPIPAIKLLRLLRLLRLLGLIFVVPLVQLCRERWRRARGDVVTPGNREREEEVVDDRGRGGLSWRYMALPDN